MATLTIRNVPDDLHADLKERARRNRRSLNQEVIAELSGDSGTGGVSMDEGERKRRRAEQMIAMVDEMRKGMTRFMTAEEIDAAIEEGRA